MRVNHEIGAGHRLAGSYTLGREDPGFDQYLDTKGSLARSAQRVLDKANSYLKPGEAKWQITQIKVQGSRNGSGLPDDDPDIRYDEVDNLIITVGKNNSV